MDCSSTYIHCVVLQNNIFWIHPDVYKPAQELTYDENVVVKIVSQDTPTILKVTFVIDGADTVGLEYLTDFKVMHTDVHTTENINPMFGQLSLLTQDGWIFYNMQSPDFYFL